MADQLTAMFDVVVVGYNSLLSASSAVAAAQVSRRVRAIVFCDNSTDAVVCEQNRASAAGKVAYVPCGGNRGLSYAYNVALDRVRAPYVVLFDDDTAVGAEYFDGVAAAVGDGAHGVFVPVVTANGRAFSPSVRTLGSFRPVKDLARLPAGFSAVNAGMVVSTDVLADYRYDERLFLDFVDHTFVSDMRRRGVPVTLMPAVTIDQSFSATDDDAESAARRHEIFRRDSAVYYSGIAGWVVRRVRLAVRRAKRARMRARR